MAYSDGQGPALPCIEAGQDCEKLSRDFPSKRVLGWHEVPLLRSWALGQAAGAGGQEPMYIMLVFAGANAHVVMRKQAVWILQRSSW